MKKILLALLIAIVALLGYAATRPDTFHVERSITIGAPPDVVFPHVASFAAWRDWSPWAKIDPGMHEELGGTDGAVGSTYSWSGNSKVGKGRMTITALEAPSRVGVKLEFFEPLQDTSDVTFTFVPTGDGTRVTWAMDGPMTYPAKVMCLFVSMDRMIGGDFEKGLADLKTASEGTPTEAGAEQ